MTRTHWTLLVLLVGALAFGGWSRRDASYARAESRRLAGVVDSLAKARSRVDTVHAVTVRTVTRHTASLDTMTVEVERWKHDTILVVEYVTRADSLARACTALIASCDEKVAARDALLAAVQQKARAEAAVMASRVPSLTRKGCALGGAAGGGYGGAVLADAQGAAVGALAGGLVGWLACR